MSKPTIRTYEDLLLEEQRLTQVIKGHEVLLKQDLHSLKEHVRPAVKVAGFLNKMATRDHSGPLADFGLDFSIDLLVRKLILGRAGWLTKIVVPFVVKNYSSHIITEEHRAKLTEKIQHFIGKLRPKKKKDGSAPKEKAPDAGDAEW
jgi:hypothetical protein